ncbi:MAG: undecaprenyl-phosphate glucose phosphotransferase [Hyphomicrobiaceae bacterium]
MSAIAALAQTSLSLPDQAVLHRTPKTRPRVKSWSRKIVADLTIIAWCSISTGGAALATWSAVSLRIASQEQSAILISLLPAAGTLSLLLAFLVRRGHKCNMGTYAICAITVAAYALALLCSTNAPTFSANLELLILWISGAGISAAVASYALARILSFDAIGLRLRINTAVYGVSADASKLCRELRQSSDHNFAGLFEDRCTVGRVELFGVPVIGGVGDLTDLVRRGLIDEIILAIPPSAVERTSAIARQLKQFPVDVRISVKVDPAVGSLKSPSPPSHLASARLVEVHAAPIRDWGVILKMIEDRAIGIIALVCAAPLFLFIAAAIKLDSPGPVFFRQKRHGVSGKSIVVWKFRSMRVMENGPVVQQATKGDARVTRVGRILRKTSFDELPQLINVVLGDMSLVGPRPHAVAHNDYYGNLIANYNGRNQVRPGITGWAQVNGFRGETQDAEQMARRVEHDIWYISNWSFLLDLKILLLTPVFGLVHKNAY